MSGTMSRNLRPQWLQQVILALFSFLLSQCVLALVLHYLLHTNYFSAQNWVRWDSGHYLSIAEHGYEIMPCSQVPGFAPDSPDTCGNTGWFPGYPLLIRALAWFTGDYVVTAGILSKILLLVSLFMAVKIAGFERISVKSVAFSLLTAFSFGFVYYSAVFPMSGVVCCALCAYYFASSGRMWFIVLFCFLAAAFYPVGCLVAASLALWHITDKAPFRQRFLQSTVIGLAGLAGLVAVFMGLQITVGDWRGFLLVQDKYAHGYQSPLLTLQIFFNTLPLPLHWPAAIAYQTLFTYLLYIGVSFFFIYRRMHRVPVYRWTYIYLSVFLWFSLCQAGDYSRFRSESLLLPALLLLKDAPTWVLAGSTLFLLAVGIPMAYLFFAGVLI